MSLLEDVFLEDEANEAEELERVIEGDEFEERRRSDSDDNSEKEDEAEEEKRKVDPTKQKSTRFVKNPRVTLNPARLTGPRGIQTIPDYFKDFKFKGKGHEKEDLDLVLKKLEHWAYRLYPKFEFEDCLKKIETLGKKRPVAVHLQKIRSDQFLPEDVVVQNDSSDEDTPIPVQEPDEFDKLLQQQIELARTTPAPSSHKKIPNDVSSPPKDNRLVSLTMPKAVSSPSINEEQRERMRRSRQLAEERRLARMKNAGTNINQSVFFPQDTVTQATAQNSKITEVNSEHNIDIEEIKLVRKHNRRNVIDSSDEETDVQTNISIAVDVHKDNGSNVEHYDTADPGNITHINLNDDSLHMEGTAVNKIGASDETAHEFMPDNDTELTLVENNFIPNTYKGKVISSGNTKNVDGANTVNTSIDAVESVTDNSGTCEELRYDDSDVNNDISIKDTENLSIVNEKDSQLGTMVDSVNVIEDKSDKLKPTKNSTIPASDNLDNADSFTEVIDDIMDVDFSEDF